MGCFLTDVEDGAKEKGLAVWVDDIYFFTFLLQSFSKIFELLEFFEAMLVFYLLLCVVGRGIIFGTGRVRLFVLLPVAALVTKILLSGASFSSYQ